MAGDAGTLFANGFFCNLNQNFLTFFQKLGDEWNILRFLATKAPAAATSASSLAAPRIERWACSTLGISRCCRRSPYFDSDVDRTVAAGFGIKQRFRFGLGFLEFGLFGFLGFLFRNWVENFFARCSLIYAAFDDKWFCLFFSQA